MTTEMIGVFPLDDPAMQGSITVTADAFEDWWRGIEIGGCFGTGSLGGLLCDTVRAVAAIGSEEVVSALVYTVSELIENALKANPAGEIEVSLGVDGEGISCFVIHPIPPESIPSLRKTLSKFVVRDSGELVCRQVEENVKRPGSGLGCLTIIHHYGARLSWKFEHRVA